jgi:hypothetical protein
MPINFQPTAPWLFQKPPQYVEETSFGVTPASPVFKLMGSITGISPNIGITKEVVRSVGRRDPTTQTKMMEMFSGAFKYRPFASDFLKYGVNLPNESSPTGTNAASVTILWSQLINGVEKYFVLQGCKTDKISVEISKDGGVVVGQDLRWYKTTAFASSVAGTGITTPTYITSIPSTQPWSSLTGGANPFSIEGTVLPVDRLKVDVNQNLFAISPNGSSSVEYLGAGIREISVDFDTWVKDSVLFDYLMALTLVDAQYIVKYDATTPTTLTFTDIGFDSRTSNFEGTAKDAQREGITGTPISVVLAGS